MSHLENIIEYYADIKYLVKNMVKDKKNIAARVSSGNKDKFIQYADGKYQYMGGSHGLASLFSGEKQVMAALENASYFDLFELDQYNKPSKLLYINEDGSFYSSKFIEDYNRYLKLEKPDMTPGLIYDRQYSFNGTEGDGLARTGKYLAIPCFYYERNGLRERERDKIWGTHELKKVAETFATHIDTRGDCVLVKLVEGTPDYSNAEIITITELEFIVALNAKWNHKKDGTYTEVEREVIPNEDSKVVLSYIKSFNRCADESSEMRSIIKCYANDSKESGIDYAEYVLINYLNQPRMEDITNARFLLDKSPKNFEAHVKSDTIDFVTVLKKVLENMHPAGDNELCFTVKDDSIVYRITKLDNENYNLEIKKVGGGKYENKFDLNCLVNLLHNLKEGEFPREEKERIAKELKETHLVSDADSVLEAKYRKNPAISENDSPTVKVFKMLAAGRSVILRKNMDRTKTIEFIYFQKVSNYIVMKTVECLWSNSRLAQLNFKGFGDERTAKYKEIEADGSIKRIYYLTAETADNPYSKNPDVEICSRELTTSELQVYLDKLYWRAWDIEASKYLIDKIDIKNGVSVWSDREVFRIARDGTMYDSEKIQYVCENMWQKDLTDIRNRGRACGIYAASETKNIDGETDTYTQTESSIIVITEAASGKANTFDAFKLDGIKVVTDSTGEKSIDIMRRICRDAIYMEQGALKISIDHKRSVERFAKLIYEKGDSAAVGMTYLNASPDAKERAAYSVKKYVELCEYCLKYKKRWDKENAVFDEAYVNKQMAEVFNAGRQFFCEEDISQILIKASMRDEEEWSRGFMDF